MYVYGPLKVASLEIIQDANPSPAYIGRIYGDSSAVSNTYTVPKFHDGARWLRIQTSAATLRLASSDYTVTLYDDNVLCDGSGGAFTVTLLSPATAYRKTYRFLRTDMTLGTAVTIAASGGGDVIKTAAGNVSSTTIDTKGEELVLYSDGTDWRVMHRSIPEIKTSYTPGCSWSANTTITANWSRRGNQMDLDVLIALSGAPTAASLTFDTPTNTPNIDTAAMLDAVAGVTSFLSEVSIYDSSVPDRYTKGTVYYSDSNTLAVYKDDGDGTASVVNATAPVTFATGDKIHIKVKGIPITGWNAG